MESSIENCRQLSDKRSVGETRDVIKSFEGCSQEGLGQSAPISNSQFLDLDWPNSSCIRAELQSRKGPAEARNPISGSSRYGTWASRLEKQTGLEESCLSLEVVELKLL